MSCEGNVLDYIGTGKENAITGRELTQLSGLSEREIREVVSNARRQEIILNDQDGAGYYRPALPEEAANVRHYLVQEESRIQSLNESLMPARKYLDYMQGSE